MILYNNAFSTIVEYVYNNDKETESKFDRKYKNFEFGINKFGSPLILTRLNTFPRSYTKFSFEILFGVERAKK